MLDNNDMEMLKAYFDPKFDAINQRLGSMDERFESIDEKFESIDKRFVSMDERFVSIDKRFESIERRLNDLNQKIETRTDLLLREIGITRDYLEKRIDKIQAQIDELVQYYRITRLENNNNDLLQKRVDKMDDRITKLEEQMTA